MVTTSNSNINANVVKAQNLRNQKLKQTLARVASPVYKDLTTPLISRKRRLVNIDGESFELAVDREKTLKEAADLIKPDCMKIDSRLWDLEMHELTKAGPKSWRPKKDWWSSQLSAYLDKSEFSPETRSFNAAVQGVVARIQYILEKGYFKPISEVSSSGRKFSGMPYLTRSELVESDIIRDAEEIMSRIKRGQNFEYYYSVLGHRGQSKGLKELSKQRVVWMYPKATVLVGLSWLQTVIPQLSTTREFVGFNDQATIDATVTEFLSCAANLSTTVVSCDFSQFDSTISPEVVFPVFEGLTLQTPLYSILEELFTSPIMTPSGLISGRNKGVPSGHALTNLIDSIANLVCLHYIAERANTYVARATVLGDDSVVVYGKPIPLEVMSGYAGELGMHLNPAKSVSSDDYCHYLQRVYFRKEYAGGIRSITRTLNSMISLERWDTDMSPEYNVARWWMQLQEIRNHPAREKFFEWVKDQDKLHLGSGNLRAVDKVFENADSQILSATSWKYHDSVLPNNFWFRELLI